MEATVPGGGYSTRWRLQYQVETTVTSGGYSTRWRLQYQVEATVTSGGYSTRRKERLQCLLRPTEPVKELKSVPGIDL